MKINQFQRDFMQVGEQWIFNRMYATLIDKKLELNKAHNKLL